MVSNREKEEWADACNKCDVLYELSVQEDIFDCTSSISSAIEYSKAELQKLNETIESIKELKPDCDKTDYILAASSGALCGIMDIFFVGKPGESPVGDITDKWFSERTMDFARLCGWEGEGEKSAIKSLEEKFKIPYDQRGAGDAAGFIRGLNPSSHHFKSLAHNPTLCGLFFSILDQFQNTSHFISAGEIISIQQADEKFELRGHNISSKLFCAFVNWIGHLISDMSGSSKGKGRGMGIPSPFWAWTNNVIALKSFLRIPVSEFNDSFNELALSIYEKGFDTRFQAAQAIPVIVNELVTRMIYSVRRLCRYFRETERKNRTFSKLWKECEPFSNVTVKRMLTVSHGTFCIMDIGDAAIRGIATGAGILNPAEFLMRLNVVGVGRFTISLYGEGKRAVAFRNAEKEAAFAERKRNIVDNYIRGLNILAAKYNDSYLLTFADDLQKIDLYKTAFAKSVELARLRGVPDDIRVEEKKDIDAYFNKKER